jgi:hypothetical protein
VPDSDSAGGATEGTKSPSTSGRPEPETSMNRVLSLGAVGFTVSSWVVRSPALSRNAVSHGP